jgi:protein-S-isoprenylcysteine O-methyltransferase Ste14
LLAAASLALAGWAFVSLGASFRVAPTPLPGARLVRTGIYRWVRHPMYVSVMLATAAAVVARPSVPVMIVAGMNALLYLAKTRYEERALDAHYAEYAGYRRQTLGLPFTRRRKPEREP